MSNAFIKLEEQLAAAQAEVARLHEGWTAAGVKLVAVDYELKQAREEWDAAHEEATEWEMAESAERTARLAATAEIAVLRRVLAQLSDVTVCFNGCDPSDMTCASNAAKAALSAPSAAEPLLADIRAAVEAMDAHTEQRIIARDAREKSRAAANGLRRWMP